ncbi:tripartite tricarboxylate transporter TctB family protein [Thalassospira mesophila]|uniref:DUF1468 domain-containing protein n=1 Tax=Thalassospira mesophila TaxID=1293891 RepID=A0A1Y2KXL0_9PROT|nr:tripartite tricarboxylate transporter TctB family protein [Thalassospira mesophila]OSQ36964.1 hypothetical protein TMES_16000 [Thalassospira mesophila]
MIPNRDFYTGLVATAFFALVLFVLIPVYVRVPSFIPGFAPPPDMWPRVIGWVGVVMGALALVLAVPKMRRRSSDQITPIGAYLCANRIFAYRFICMIAGFAAFVYLMPKIGFLTATIVLLAFLFIMTGDFTKRAWMIGLSIIFPIFLYVVFTEITHTPFPHGKWFSLARLLHLI